MGFGNTFVDVLRRLVGISKDPPVAVIDPNAAATIGESEPEPEANGDADDDSLPPASARDEWEDMQAFVARCEAEAIELCGIDIDDPASFWEHYSRIEADPNDSGADARTKDPDDAAREARAKAAGFSDLHHWEWVSQYCQIKWSELVEDTDPPEIRAKASFSAAAERLRVHR